MSVSTAVAL